MRDFVSPMLTHAYVASLEERIAMLEARLEASQKACGEPIDLDAVNTLPRTRNAYMRDYMAERRKKAREQVV